MKTNYNIRNYLAIVDNGNEEEFGFYLMARGPKQAKEYVEAYILRYYDKYHIACTNYRIYIKEIGDSQFGRINEYTCL